MRGGFLFGGSLVITTLLKEPMRNHTTFKVGGPADKFVTTDCPEELIELLATEKPLYIIGNGSNLVVRDKGIRGTVVKYTANRIVVEGNMIIADSGAMLRDLANAAMENSLTGLEFAHGIPGTVGGAVYMNAGAWGGKMADIVTEVKAIAGEEKVFTEFGFKHRQSCFQKNGAIILEVILELQPGDKNKIKQAMKDMADKRRRTQPLNYPSAGTVFKKGMKWTKRAGLAGYTIGDAQVSTKNPGFITNKGNASAADIEELIKHIYKTVKKKKGKKLKLEVEVIGE